MKVFTVNDARLLSKMAELEDAQFLEVLFRELNHVDGTEWIADKPLRSLSVGDVVRLQDARGARTYHCDWVGWSKV